MSNTLNENSAEILNLPPLEKGVAAERYPDIAAAVADVLSIIPEDW